MPRLRASRSLADPIYSSPPWLRWLRAIEGFLGINRPEPIPVPVEEKPSRKLDSPR